MISIFTSSGYRNLKTDEYYIVNKDTGIDELVFSMNTSDDLYRYVSEETNVLETTSGQLFVVKSIDGGQTQADVRAELDLDDWKHTIYLDYYNNTSAIGTTLSAILPDSWTLINETASYQRRGISMPGPTPLDIASQCMTTYKCAIRFDNKEKTATVLYPDNIADSGIRFMRTSNMRRAPEFKGSSTSLVTRLYPIGKDGLTISNVNDGVPYVENHDYTDKVVCDVWVDERYEDAESLMEDAQAKVDESAIPARTWTLDIVDLYDIDASSWPDMKLSMFQVGTVVDDARGETFTAQITEMRRYPYHPERNQVKISTTFRRTKTFRNRLMDISNPNSEYAQKLRAESGNAEKAANLLYTGAGAHNAIYRGKNLGTSVTDEQWAAISAGTFEDLYIGDYWVINGVNWRIAAFDYYYNTGDTNCATHHVTVVPDTALYTAQMNTTNTTDGAYIGSAMYTDNLANAKTAIYNAFGSDHILSHRQYLQNAVTSGYASGGSWYDSTVELMTEQNVYGCKVFGNCINGTAFPNSYTVDKSQYPLFALNPRMANIRATYWLRDVASAASFCIVYNDGNAYANYASSTRGVRPAFSIKS